MSAKTLFLSDEWDITLDGRGWLAVAEETYAIAQNVANAERLFEDDAYYDPQKGVPHFSVELGQEDGALAFLRDKLKKAAEGVEGVLAVAITDLSVERATRKATGTIHIVTDLGDADVDI